MDIRLFRTAVAKQFQAMSTHQLFCVQIEKDKLWDRYLSSFPEGSNPIYKTRTEHDCQCCKHFIRLVGGIVSIIGGELASVWDIEPTGVDAAFLAVARCMSRLVKSCAIEGPFLHYEATAGQATNRQLLEDKTVRTWDHLYLNLPSAAVVSKADIGPRLSDARATHDVLLRGLKEITRESIDIVLDLIAQNSLYRGEENRFAVQAFSELKRTFDGLQSERDKDLLAWASIHQPASITRIRNTSIGTLLTDLSEGRDLESAVKSFEEKVAPANYQRPTALVTKAMIQKAQEAVNMLGFGSALERRYATIDDVSVNDILFVDRAATKNQDVFDNLAGSVAEKVKRLDKVQEVPIADFVAHVLPTATSLELLLENRHAVSFVSLIAPCDPTAKLLFKWDNNFSWSYAGDVADSIKERVKRAGGNVSGDLCCRLAWNYSDDLDFHMREPDGYHIYYPNKRYKSPNGGELDLDANGGDGLRADPAENIFYADRSAMTPGEYTLSVNNYSRRSNGAGFEVEIEFDGQAHQIAYEKVLRTGDTLTVAKIRYANRAFEIVESLPTTQVSKATWGLTTQTYHKVKAVMLSPNYWGDRAVGNKHFFFMLEGCANEGTARGFYNEFLAASLSEHRKVFEMVGAKMRTDESAQQLSGLGFSSTQRNNVLCRVNGSFSRTIKITF